MATICIKVAEDGALSIGLEPEGEESAEGGMPMDPFAGDEGEDMGEDSYLTPVADEEELMIRLSDLLAEVRGASPMERENEDAFQSGFKSGSGSPL